MKYSKSLRIGSTLFLTAAIVCMVIALFPEKPGIRIPVHVANGQMGYIDDTGRMVIAAKWESATPFGEDGMGYVSSANRSRKYQFGFDGWIPKFRTYVSPGKSIWKVDRVGNLNSYPIVHFSQVHPLDRPTPPDAHGMSLLRERGWFRWIKTDGSEAFPGTWEKALNFKDDDPAAVLIAGRWGFINRKGETIIPLEWEQTSGFDGKGRACVAVNNRWGVINVRGELIVPLYFKLLTGFDERNMCAATLESGSGFIGPDGKILIPFRHVRVDPFDRFEMAKVVMRDDDDNLRVGWIDRTGKPVVPAIYHDHAPEWAWRFKEHELLPVCNHKGFGLIDRTGRVVVPPGGGPLAHVEDPMAAGRFWITRVPGDRSSTGRAGGFHPACYNQNGKCIWAGARWTRSQMATVAMGIFGAISVIMFIMLVRRPAAGQLLLKLEGKLEGEPDMSSRKGFGK